MKWFLLVPLFHQFLIGAPLKVVTTTPDLAWAAKQIGGPLVEVKSLLSGTENPHYVDAVPEFIRLVSNADLVAYIGLELEIGWLPKVLTRSGNAQVQPGGKGHCETGLAIHVLEKPQGNIDRSMGDIHPQGNPHYWLSPIALAEAGHQLAECLSKTDPAHIEDYKRGDVSFTKDMRTLRERIRNMLTPILPQIGNGKIVEYHREFAYFLEAYGLKSFGSIEEKPGISPSAGRLGSFATSAKAAGVNLAIAGEYAPKDTLRRFQELSGIPTIQLPTSSKLSGKPSDYVTLQTELASEMISAINKRP